jgi:hypothetical protein
LKPEQVEKLLNNLEKEAFTIKDNALRLSWYMRGGVTYEDILNMSLHERETLNKIVEDNLETTKKSQLPFF